MFRGELAGEEAHGFEFGRELARLNILLARTLDQFRARRPEGTNGLGGVAVFDHEVDSFLESAPWDDPEPLDIEDLEPSGPFLRLATLFSLSRTDLDLVLLALAPEIHVGYGRVYAYLHNDIGRTRPSASLAMDVLAEGWEQRLAVRARLGAGSLLARNHLLTSVDELVLDDALVRFLLGTDPAIHLHLLPEMPFDELILDEPVRHTLGAALAGEQTLLCMRGDPGAGKRTIAAALAHRAGARLFLREIDPADRDPADGATRVARWMRDVALAGGWPCVDLGSESLDRTQPMISALVAALQRDTFPSAIVLSESTTSGGLEGLSTAVVDVALPVPRPTTRREAWRTFLARERLEIDATTVDSVAAVFGIGIGKIQRAAREAAARARRAAPTPMLLHESCRAQAHHKLDKLAEHVRIVHGWPDIVLPPDQLAQLREVAAAVRQRPRVLDTWEFGQRVAVAPGVSALFFGPSGTGKTMSASILAGDLGMELYRVDLSRVVSKYIGETEKNLDALFDEARRAHALLFFDEADAIFGKRSEVKDAHDRYANIEVAFLLQRMESFEGITILATNLRKNIDQAFLRRVQFAVEFPSPTPQQRLEIWRRVWPKAAAVGSDIDLEFLAQHFEWPGGNIRNIALKAAYLAASDDQVISMKHVVAATRREFQKLGRLSVEQEFGRYGHLIASRPAP
jgi:hypothetical protein